MRRVPWALIERVDDEWIVLDPARDRYLRLNRSGAALWDRLAAAATAAELAAHLERVVGAPAGRAAADVAAFLESLTAYGLIEPADASG